VNEVRERYTRLPSLLVVVVVRLGPREEPGDDAAEPAKEPLVGDLLGARPRVAAVEVVGGLGPGNVGVARQLRRVHHIPKELHCQ
jgi:hypothetical protein